VDTNIIQGFWLWFHSFLRVAFHSTMSRSFSSSARS
jgi:hypothetical protein